MNSFTINNTEYTIRLFNHETDSVEELTELLHKAYKRLADMGLNFVATYQDTEHTRRYFEKGKCFILTNGKQLIETIFYYTKCGMMRRIFIKIKILCCSGNLPYCLSCSGSDSEAG